MFYSIRHLTRFRYRTPVSESLMEVRMHPRTEGGAAMPLLPAFGRSAHARV